ncbi:MAG TPA: glycosyltransferase [Kofleriaceae bacterium]|nr:glycosyltransferase [Kofleriaceae bacterium]
MINAASPVLYIMDTLGLSGRTKGIIDLALALDPARYRPIFCSLGEETSELAERLAARGVPIEVLPLSPGLRPDGVRQLAALIRRRGIRVVHPVNPRPLLYAGLAARLTGVRAAVGSLSAFACQTPDREYKFLPQELANRGRRQAMRNQLACRLMRYVVAVSDDLGERFCRFTASAFAPLGELGYQSLRERMRTIAYGIDLAPYRAVTPLEIAEVRARVGAGTGTDTVLVGSVGRLVEQKDYPTQLRAFAIAARAEPRLRMVLAGDGPLRGEIVALAESLGIADRICLLGHWTRVPALLRALDVFVIASKFEPYGVALLEAKCAGCAIVATAVNEMPKILGFGATGTIVPSESPEHMAQAFVTLAADARLRRELSARAYAEAEHTHSIEAVAHAYQALYDRAS